MKYENFIEISFDGLYHKTHNEPEKDEVITFLIQWLDNLYSQKAEK